MYDRVGLAYYRTKTIPWDRQDDRIAQKRIQKTYITIEMIIVVKRQSNISLRKHKYVYERKESTNS